MPKYKGQIEPKKYVVDRGIRPLFIENGDIKMKFDKVKIKVIRDKTFLIFFYGGKKFLSKQINNDVVINAVGSITILSEIQKKRWNNEKKQKPV